MIVLALDLATQCGVAIGPSGGSPRAWSVDLGKGRSEDDRLSACLSLVSTLIRDHSPDLLAIEAPIGGREASQYLVGLVACARGVACNRKVRIERVTSASARKHFVGKALTTRHFPGLSKAKAKIAIKRVVQDRCRLLGWPSEDLDGCDALAVWDYSCAVFCGALSTPQGGLFHG